MTVNPRQSFKLKLVFWVVCISLGAFVTLVAISGYYVHREVHEEVNNVANGKLDVVVNALKGQMTETLISARNFSGMARSSSVTHNPDSVYSLEKLFLQANTEIQGITVAYVPEAGLPYSRRTAPYTMRNKDGSFSCRDLNDSYDYRTHDWYILPHYKHKNRWSPAFREANGSIVTCFSMPLTNAEGKEYAVLVLDINVDELSDTLQYLRPYPASRLSVIDGNGRYVANTEKELVLGADIDSLCKVPGVEVNQKIVDDIENGRRGMDSFVKNGRLIYTFYAPVEMNGWTVTLEVPRRELAKDYDNMYRTIFLVIVIVLLVLVFVTYTIINRLTLPLEKFSSAARHISHGNFKVPLPVIADNNELYDLRQALASMEVSLSNYVDQLKAQTSENARIEGELNIARGIQQAMLPQVFPPFPERPDVDIFASLTPAKEVSGDLYDYLLDGDDVYFCIGDVSGKGVPASLFMAIVRCLFHFIAAKEKKPAAIASRLNEAISEHNEENMFITMYIGKVNLKDGTVIVCNCGHNCPLSNGKIDMATGLVYPNDEMRFFTMAPTNIPVGVIPDYDYKEVKLHLTPGVTMFLYTDGVTEAENEEHHLFGDDRLCEVLNSCGKDASASKLVSSVVESVHQHSLLTEQSDDITMLCIRLNGTPIAMDSIRRLAIQNNIEELSRLEPFLKSFCEAYNVPSEMLFQLNLALDEAMANSVNYAYPNGQQGMVTLTAQCEDDKLIFKLYDQGKPFDPTKKGENVDTTLPAETRPIGGLGIFLIKKMMDSVTYERREDKNVLTMVKDLPPTPPCNGGE